MTAGHVRESRAARAQARKKRNSWLTGALIALGAILAVVAAIFLGNALTPNTPVEVPVTAPVEQSAPQSEPEPEPEPDPVEFTLVFGGDILIHNTVGWAALNDGVYDFYPQFTPTEPLIANADLAICGMEVPVGEEGSEVAGYPVFSAPPSVITGLRQAGWDGCWTATNHALDQGFTGLTRTLDKLDSEGMGHVGTARTEVEAGSPQFYELEKDGQTLTVAMISATEMTNGIPLPEDAPWAVEMLNADRAIALAAAAREAGADLVVANMHAGEEYQTEPTETQVQYAEALAASGQVDILVGGHAHVPQPFALLPGGPHGDGMWVAYGTGNFISGQGAPQTPARSNSGILQYFNVVVDGDSVEVVSAEWAAINMDREGGYVPYWLAASGAAGSTASPEHLAEQYQMVVEAVGGGPATELVELPAGGATVTVVPRPR